MPTKPAALPQWGSDVGATFEPSGAQKAAGFSANRRLPARWLNWVLNLLYQWIQYLNAPVGSGTTPAMTMTAGTGAGSVALRLDPGNAASIPLYALAQGAAAGLAPLVAGFPGTGAICATGQTGLPGLLAVNVGVGPGLWGTTANPAAAGLYATGVAGSQGAVLVGNGYSVNTAAALAPAAGAVVGTNTSGLGVADPALRVANAGRGPAAVFTTGAGAADLNHVVQIRADGIRTGAGYGLHINGAFGNTGGDCGAIRINGGAGDAIKLDPPTSGAALWARQSNVGGGIVIDQSVDNNATTPALRVIARTGTPNVAPLRIGVSAGQPTGPNEVGDMYITTAGVLKICTVAGSPGTWVSVGAQT